MRLTANYLVKDKKPLALVILVTNGHCRGGDANL